ncbi:hypothetical protein [Pseudomonas syringae]|uniref:hypothetical protein n=1 Tax=Pseudomonas syringae TaxID=317 RepID=UPI00245EFE72|nr:hypothetical protein [Pseudomonas syringae]MDH4602428.1 hypothetical protein [Pseudomonas syringae pv. papulans]
MNMSPSNLTFETMRLAYIEVLTDKLDKALRLSDGGAVFMEDGEIFSVTLSETGEVEMGTAGCISPLAWDDDRGCWESEESAQACVSAVNSPVFIELPI